MSDSRFSFKITYILYVECVLIYIFYINRILVTFYDLTIFIEIKFIKSSKGKYKCKGYTYTRTL